jgi:hypothetical protein
MAGIAHTILPITCRHPNPLHTAAAAAAGCIGVYRGVSGCPGVGLGGSGAAVMAAMVPEASGAGTFPRSGG